MPDPTATNGVMSNDFRRVLYVSSFPPSGVAGSAVIMRDLLEEIPRDRLALVVSRQQATLARNRDGHDPPWKTFKTWLPRQRNRFRILRTIVSVLRVFWIPILALQTLRAARAWRAETILAVQDSGEYLAAGWLASRLARTDLVIYMTDDWEAGARKSGHLAAAVARFTLPRLARDAAHCWFISDTMRAEWRDRFGTTGDVLTHAVDLNRFSPIQRRWTGGLRIACVGSVYSVNAAPICNVAEAVEQLRSEGVDLTLHLFTANASEVNRLGLNRRRGVTSGAVSAKQLPAALAKFDMGLVALTFDESLRRIVDVAYPTKLAEYFASGLPVLVHAPASAVAAKVVAGAGCGVVVAENSVDAVRVAFQALLTSPQELAEMSIESAKYAEAHHDLAQTRNAFYVHLRTNR